MRDPAYSGQFKKDIRLAEKRGKDLEKIRRVMNILIQDLPIPKQLMDHQLHGEWKHFRDLHMEPDWVLIYRIDGNVVRFERTGAMPISSIDDLTTLSLVGGQIDRGLPIRRSTDRSGNALAILGGNPSATNVG